ncbi:MAG: selenoneine biosynthesis selenosugar synthase SenB, partial [Blastocatellia bacterium]
MKIALITPASSSPYSGNTVTARRYARILRGLGHRVILSDEHTGQDVDLLIALHAKKSYASISRFRRTHRSTPIIVALTGTDLYRDIHTDPRAKESLQLATRLVVLQGKALDELPPDQRRKATVVYQSVEPYSGGVHRLKTGFRVAVVANLREEKDPLRAAMAARLLPVTSRIRVVHIGGALSRKLGRAAVQEMRVNPRYRWVGSTPHWKARRLISGSHLLAITSRMEGSSNVLCEALASGTPVLASRIPGLAGTLGTRYPGYFPVGDTSALAGLMCKAESDRRFYDHLKNSGAGFAQLVQP